MTYRGILCHSIIALQRIEARIWKWYKARFWCAPVRKHEAPGQIETSNKPTTLWQTTRIKGIRAKVSKDRETQAKVKGSKADAINKSNVVSKGSAAKASKANAASKAIKASGTVETRIKIRIIATDVASRAIKTATISVKANAVNANPLTVTR